jgi:hypothetical protein
VDKKGKNRTAKRVNRALRSRKPGYRRRSGGVDPLVWVGAVAGIIVVLLVFNVWQSGAFARPPAPSRGEEPTDLLPLTEANHPLRGGHDMALIPQQTPAPRLAPSDVPVPQLDISDVSHDFGRIPKRQDVVHIFAVQNTGTADLIISNLVTSCGCTTAELSSSVIPAGQRADLTVIFDPDFHETEGQVMRLVWFASNDPTQPWVEVRITADVLP